MADFELAKTKRRRRWREVNCREMRKDGNVEESGERGEEEDEVRKREG